MIEVFAVKIDKKLSDVEFNFLLPFVSQEKQNRIKKFRNYDDAQRALIADILTRMVIRNKKGIKNSKIIFGYNDFGKPYLKDYGSFNFNISHSNEWVVCATHFLSVGIDIEYIHPVDMQIAKRFFSKTEYDDLLVQDQLTRLSFFYDLWTLKESYIKAVGKGLSIQLDTFSIRFINNNILLEDKNKLGEYYFKQYDIGEKYKLSICGLENDFDENVQIINIDYVYNNALFYLA